MSTEKLMIVFGDDNEEFKGVRNNFINGGKKKGEFLIIDGDHIVDGGGMNIYGIYFSIFYFYVISRREQWMRLRSIWVWIETPTLMPTKRYFL